MKASCVGILLATCLILATSSPIFADVPPRPPDKSPSVLQMRLVADAAATDTEEMVIVDRSNDPNSWQVVHVKKAVLLDSSAVKSAFTVKEQDGRTSIMLEFNDAGAVKFAEVTRDAKGKRLAIVINGGLYAAPHIMTSITGGKAQISGRFTDDEARQLAAKIDAATK